MKIQDLAQRGRRFSSFLMVRTVMVGIAFGVHFSQSAQYLPNVSCSNVPMLLIEFFSLVTLEPDFLVRVRVHKSL